MSTDSLNMADYSMRISNQCPTKPLPLLFYADMNNYGPDISPKGSVDWRSGGGHPSGSKQLVATNLFREGAQGGVVFVFRQPQGTGAEDFSVFGCRRGAEIDQDQLVQY